MSSRRGLQVAPFLLGEVWAKPTRSGRVPHFSRALCARKPALSAHGPAAHRRRMKIPGCPIFAASFAAKVGIFDRAKSKGGVFPE